MQAPTLDFYIGKDGIPVIHIDTPDEWPETGNGPVCRVYMNDDIGSPLFDNSPDT